MYLPLRTRHFPGFVFTLALFWAYNTAPVAAMQTYHLRITPTTSNCSTTIPLPTPLVVMEQQLPEGHALILPDIEPEHVSLAPVFYDNDKVEPGIQAERVDTFPAESVGTLVFKKTLVLGPPNASGNRTGTLTFANQPRVVTDLTADQEKDAEILRASRCESEARLFAEPVTVAGDTPVDLILRRWSLLKQHTDHVTQMDPEASMPPLRKGVELPGDRTKVTFLWRLSRAHFLHGEQLPTDDKDGRLAAFSAGIEVAKRALELQPDHGAAAFFLAANTGRYNTTKGLIKTLTGLDDFERLCEQAIIYGSDYNLMGYTVIGDAHHALGQFYRLVPDSGLLRLVTGTRGDIDKSIEHHRESLKHQPDRGDYIKELIVSLLCKSDRDNDPNALKQARELLDDALASGTWAYDNPELDKAHLKSLMQSPRDACSYSRDQYQAD